MHLQYYCYAIVISISRVIADLGSGTARCAGSIPVSRISFSGSDLRCSPQVGSQPKNGCRGREGGAVWFGLRLHRWLPGIAPRTLLEQVQSQGMVRARLAVGRIQSRRSHRGRQTQAFFTNLGSKRGRGDSRHGRDHPDSDQTGLGHHP